MSQSKGKPQEKGQLRARFSLFSGSLLLRHKTLLAISLSVGAAYAGIGVVGPVRVLYAQSRGASLVLISAMASAYLISNFVFAYPVGWLADHCGRKQVMLAALATEALLSAAYLLITDPVLFLVLRFLEGITAAMLLPAARALIIDTVPTEQQGEAFGIFGAFFNAGFLLGPGIGGFLAMTGYTAAFLAAIVFRLVGFALVLLAVRQAARSSVQIETHKSRYSHKALFTLPLLATYIIAFGDYLYTGFDQTVMPLWMHDHLGAPVATIGMAYVMWSVPLTILSPIGGQLADRRSRALLILVFGLAQVPFYVAYGFMNAAIVVVILFALQSCVNTMMLPSVDASVAASSPGTMRAQVQGIYSTVGLIGSFVGASSFPPLYSLNFRTPLFVMGIAYGMCILLGGTMLYVAEHHRQKK